MSNKNINRAGLIPYYIENGIIQMLFMKPSDSQYGGSCFQLIKGKIDGNETSLQAAIREAQEESGLFKPNMKHTPVRLGTFLGKTDVFIVEIKDPEMFGDFDTKEVDSTKWMSPQEFEQQGRDLHKPVIRAADRVITDTHNN